jgi:hypothetical protein
MDEKSCRLNCILELDRHAKMWSPPPKKSGCGGGWGGGGGGGLGEPFMSIHTWLPLCLHVQYRQPRGTYYLCMGYRWSFMLLFQPWIIHTDGSLPGLPRVLCTCKDSPTGFQRYCTNGVELVRRK